MKELPYVISPELEEAVLTAEVVKRPLLVRGEPGTGKTQLAEFIAARMNLPIFKWHIKSITTAKDGLYFYDAVSRLNDSRFTDEKTRDKVHNIENYIRMGALGEAFSREKKSVVLIDEIDKADIEFPNDLLLELDEMEFTVQETGRKVKAKERPLVIITSNNEKELPDAFLRRCIFHYIDFPNPELMKRILFSHYPDLNKEFSESVMNTFYRVRKLDDLRKKPSTSELLDWIQILIHQGVSLQSGSRIPFLGALVKNEDDIKGYSGRFTVN